MTHETIIEKLRERFGKDEVVTSAFRDNRRIIVAAERAFAVLECLKEECGFDMLADLTAVDYLHYPDARDRFGVVYVLVNTTTGLRLALPAIGPVRSMKPLPVSMPSTSWMVAPVASV